MLRRRFRMMLDSQQPEGPCQWLDGAAEHGEQQLHRDQHGGQGGGQQPYPQTLADLSRAGVRGKLHGVALDLLSHGEDGTSLVLALTAAEAVRSAANGIDLDRLPLQPDLPSAESGPTDAPRS